MKFLLFQVLTETTHSSGLILNSLNTNNNRSNSNRIADTAKPELIFNFESVSAPLQVVNIKDFIAQNKKIRIENIGIFLNPYVDQDSSYGLPDEFDILKLFTNKTLSTNFLSVAGTFNTTMLNSNNNSRDNNSPKLYFRILKDVPLVKIVIEYFLSNIDKILLEVSINCSVFIVKYLLRKKLLIPENEQNLLDLNSQKPFKNDDIIGNLIGSSDNSIRLNNSQFNYPTSAVNKDDSLNASAISEIKENNFQKNFAKILKIQLIRKGERKCSIGIDFSFNILKDIKKIEFSDEAPSFREASDGLNIFCYCKNKSCKIYEELFVVNKGSGRFDLLKEIAFIRCPRCNSNKIEARNLGFINCEWSYRGYLTYKKNCCTSGDGLTIDNKLYVLNEVILNQQIEKLDILVKEKINVPLKIESNNYNNEIDSDGNIDYDSIGLESIRSCHFKESKIQANLQNRNKNLINITENNELNNSIDNSCFISDSKYENKIEKSKVNFKINNLTQNLNNENKEICNFQNNNKNYTYAKLDSKFSNNDNLSRDNYKKTKTIKNDESTNNILKDKEFNKSPIKNFNLVKTKTQELEIITEKQPKFELTNCISFFGRNKIENKTKSDYNNNKKIEIIERNKTENFKTTENNNDVEKEDKCLIF